MSTDPTQLDETVARLLASETFEAHELPDVLARRGYSEADIRAATARVVAKMGESQGRSSQRAEARRLRAGRLLRFGVLTLAVGLGWTLYFGGGIVDYLLVIAVGGAFLAAGYRAG